MPLNTVTLGAALLDLFEDIGSGQITSVPVLAERWANAFRTYMSESVNPTATPHVHDLAKDAMSLSLLGMTSPATALSALISGFTSYLAIFSLGALPQPASPPPSPVPIVPTGPTPAAIAATNMAIIIDTWVRTGSTIAGPWA